ncbi:hypothetical protein L1987_67190 [Smallanthus sonchifolius]|uniref:Uncharacterized protein n=1 Tax=Smallanthus sonchifolius TaxID=185202 RepID=A0ACB9BZE7_9ASTR|nr:hypothetical protein L1987_67190 [Smallanthus sonchifolius]
MNSDTPIDYATFHLSPKRSRCQLFVSSDGNTEKIASGLVKPFVAHLKVAEEQFAFALQSISLDIESHKNVETCFTKGTLDRFVRFVSTPEVLEFASTYDDEMSQLETARKICSQGSSDQPSSTPGGNRSTSTTGDDETKKELLRAIDVRLENLKQDLATACGRAMAAGFNHDTVADLQLFAVRFGATRLNEACSKYVSVYDRRQELFYNSSWKSDIGDQASNMSVEDDLPSPLPLPLPTTKSSSSATFPPTQTQESVSSQKISSRRLSVQDRISLFENKQKDVSHSHSAAPLKRWSAAAITETISSSVKSEEYVGSNTSNFEKAPSLNKTDDDSLTASQVNSFGFYSDEEERFENSDTATMTLKTPPKKSGLKIQEASQQRRLEVSRLNSEQVEQFVPQKLDMLKQDPKEDNDHWYTSTPPSGKFIQVGSGSSQLKGNQELNDQLQMKANELEKLFAEHKLRLPRDQLNPTRQTNDQTSTKQVADPVPETTSESPVPVVPDVRNLNYLPQPSFSEVQVSDDSRGKSYDNYMKKRDARLTKLWDSNGVEKEAKMKAMHDILERQSTEMKARSADKQNSASSARRHAERLRSFHALKREEPLDFGPLQDDGDSSGFGVSRNIEGKKPLPRTPVAAIPRSATKLASTSGRRRQQPENNPLAQSVPNFSDLRKENTKPHSTATKAAARSQLRNYTLSRSTNEETPPVKEDKSRRSQSLRKSSVTSLETSEGVVLTQSKNMEPKRFVRKNTSKLKASTASEAINKEEEDEPLSVVKDDYKEELTETADQVVDGIESRMSNESEKLMDSESEHGNTLQSFSQVDHTLVAELPGESPMSWNSHTDYPFSYTHEASDVESPVTSPASWNLNPTEAAARMRKKWGISQKPNLVPSSSDLQSRKDMSRGFKRLLKFGRKSRYTENLADYISATTSEGDDETEDGRLEDLRKSRMGYSHGLTESDFYGHTTLQSSIPTPPANFRLREDHLSGKAPRSFFSLSTFRSKGSESKPR